MTKEEQTLIREIVRDHPPRTRFDGKTTGYCPTAREALQIIKQEEMKTDETITDNL